MKRVLLLFMGVGLLTAANCQWLQLGPQIDGVYLDDDFGFNTAINAEGDIIAVSAPWYEDDTNLGGMVQLYQYANANWEQLGEDIYGLVEDERFGTGLSLSLDGQTVAIGSPNHSVNGANSGQVKVLKNTSGAWVQIGDLISGEAEGDYLGLDVNLSADGLTLAVSSPYNDTTFNNGGKVEVYRLINSSWELLGTSINGQSEFAGCGKSVDLSSDGNILAIGSSGYRINDDPFGQVNIYEYNGTNWEQVGNPIVGDDMYGSFGESVSLSHDGNIIGIGASNFEVDSVNTGVVKIFQLNGSDWEQLGSTINGMWQNESFGEDVAINADGTKIVIGAYAGYNLSNFGRVVIYDFDGDNWIQDGGNITINSSFSFGKNVDMNADGTVIVSGAPGIAGKVRVYSDLPNFSIEEDHQLTDGLYPNPTKGEVFLENTSGQAIKEVRVYDVLGKFMVLQSNFTNATSELINLSNLENGIYTLNLELEDGRIEVSKVLLQK